MKQQKRKRQEEGNERATDGDKGSVKRDRQEGDRERASSDKEPNGKNNSTNMKRKEMMMKAEDVKADSLMEFIESVSRGDLRGKLAEGEDVKDKLAATQASCQGLADRLQQMQRRHAAVAAQLHASRAQLAMQDRQLGELVSRGDHLDTDILAQRKAYAELQRQSQRERDEHAFTISNIENEIRTLKALAEDRAAQVQQLQLALAASKQESSLTDQSLRLTEMDARTAQTHLQKTLAETQAEVELLRSQLADRGTTIEQLEQECQDCGKRVKELTAAVSAEQKTNAEAQSQHSKARLTLEAALRDEKLQCQTLREQLEEKTQLLAALQVGATHLEQANTQLADQLEEEADAASKLRAQASAVESLVERQSQDNKALKVNVDLLEQHVAAQQHTERELRAALMAAKSRQSQLNKTIDKERRVCAALRNELGKNERLLAELDLDLRRRDEIHQQQTNALRRNIVVNSS